MKMFFITFCLFIFSFSLVSNAQCVQIDSLIVSNVNCDELGSIEILASGGSAPYYYSINGGTSFHFSNLFSNLKKGSYDLLIMDMNDCKKEKSIAITEELELNIILRSQGNKLIANIENAAYSGLIAMMILIQSTELMRTLIRV